MTIKKQYQLKWRAPFAVLAVVCDEAAVHSVEYLPLTASALAPQNMLAAECARQFAAYVEAPQRHRFDIPLLSAKTPYQRRVREIVQGIECGKTMTYRKVAEQLGNAGARAVGNACRANAVPLIVPCHRVVSSSGIGGFMGGAGKNFTKIKTQLLQLESALA